MTTENTWKVIGRGKAGWHASGIYAATSYAPKGGHVTSSGGSLEDYLKDAAEGALVYDADAVDYGAFVDFTFKGPLCDPLLGPEVVELFADRDALAGMMPGLGGDFLKLAGGVLGGLSSLDSVGVGVYERLLRALPGIRIGHVRAGKVEWEADAEPVGFDGLPVRREDRTATSGAACAVQSSGKET